MKVFKVDELNVLWDIIKNALSGKISTIRAGTVTTGTPGTNAAVEITKSGTEAVINFTIPAGAKGDTGAKGATGTRGSRWSTGTAITGTSTTAAVFSGSGIVDALVNDMYLNTSTGYVYKCAVSGNASTAKWVYAGCINGNITDAQINSIFTSVFTKTT